MPTFEDRVQAYNDGLEKRRLYQQPQVIEKIGLYAKALGLSVSSLSDQQREFFHTALCSGNADKLIHNIHTHRLLGLRKIFDITMRENNGL